MEGFKMVNTIELKFANGEKVTTGINPDCTTKEVKEFYSDSNFLRLQDNQVVEIKFFKGFKDMLAGEREFTSVARYNEDAQCYLF